MGRHTWTNSSASDVLLLTIFKELGKELTEIENYILGLDADSFPIDGATAAVAAAGWQIEEPELEAAADPVVA